MMRLFQKSKIFSSTEEVISMFLGLVIVVVVVGLVFNFIQKRKGDVTVPGVNNYLDITNVDTNKENNKTNEAVNTYTVVRGDNLWKIAVHEYNNGYKWGEIAKANNIKNPGIIAVGQKLTIPSIEQGTDNKTAVNKENTVITNKIVAGEYTVVKNDNLWKIAVRAYGDGYHWTKIWNNNKNLIKNPSIIRVGTKIVIPKL
jgi:putative chitinase